MSHKGVIEDTTPYVKPPLLSDTWKIKDKHIGYSSSTEIVTLCHCGLNVNTYLVYQGPPIASRNVTTVSNECQMRVSQKTALHKLSFLSWCG